MEARNSKSRVEKRKQQKQKRKGRRQEREERGERGERKGNRIAATAEQKKRAKRKREEKLKEKRSRTRENFFHTLRSSNWTEKPIRRSRSLLLLRRRFLQKKKKKKNNKVYFFFIRISVRRRAYLDEAKFFLNESILECDLVFPLLLKKQREVRKSEPSINLLLLFFFFCTKISMREGEEDEPRGSPTNENGRAKVKKKKT